MTPGVKLHNLAITTFGELGYTFGHSLPMLGQHVGQATLALVLRLEYPLRSRVLPNGLDLLTLCSAFDNATLKRGSSSFGVMSLVSISVCI